MRRDRRSLSRMGKPRENWQTTYTMARKDFSDEGGPGFMQFKVGKKTNQPYLASRWREGEREREKVHSHSSTYVRAIPVA